MIIVSMKVPDFGGLEGIENHPIQVQNGFKNIQNHMRSENMVVKILRKPFWIENCTKSVLLQHKFEAKPGRKHNRNWYNNLNQVRRNKTRHSKTAHKKRTHTTRDQAKSTKQDDNHTTYKTDTHICTQIYVIMRTINMLHSQISGQHEKTVLDCLVNFFQINIFTCYLA